MSRQELIICEASELSSQLTALMELIFESGTSNGLPANDNLIGLAFNMSHKIEAFFKHEEARQKKMEKAHDK